MDLYVVFGGQSSEHEVSIKSAYNIINGADRNKYGVYGLYIHKAGLWSVFQAEGGCTLDSFITQVDTLKGADRLQVLYQHFSGRKNVIFFPIIHGLNGEDGTLQGLFEYLDFPYAGSGVLASAVGMEKSVTKLVAQSLGIPMADYRVVEDMDYRDHPQACIEALEAALGYPVFVKPSRGGSSIGISPAQDRDALIKALDLAFHYDKKALVERLVDGREIEFGLLGNEEPQCSMPGEFKRNPSFFDYHAKYLDENLEMAIPAQVPQKAWDEMAEYAVALYKAIGGGGFSRIDFFYTEAGEVLFNEINTAPGFTAVSMYPSLFTQTGDMDITALIDCLIGYGIEQYQSKKQLEKKGRYD